MTRAAAPWAGLQVQGWKRCTWVVTQDRAPRDGEVRTRSKGAERGDRCSNWCTPDQVAAREGLPPVCHDHLHLAEAVRAAALAARAARLERLRARLDPGPLPVDY